MYAAIIFVIAAVIVAVALSGSDSGDAADEEYSQSYPAIPHSGETRSRTHFIDKHLHRDDKKHARHKENQTPW